MNIKKLFASVTSVLMLATMLPVATFSANYSDELQEAYDYAYENGITTMSTIDNANMYGSLTRIALAKMISNYAMDVLGLEPDTDKECSFPDVSASLDAQYDMGVTNACQLGLMGVGITNFNPYGIVTRAEFGTVLSRALRGDEYDGATPYYKDHLKALKDAGIMTNISNPSMTEVRGYVMLMMQRADEDGVATPVACLDPMVQIACALNPEDDACPVECRDIEDEEEDTEVKAGDLSFSLSSNNPEATDVPLTSAYTTYLKFKVSSTEDVTVRSIDVMRKGLGNSTDFDKVWIENDNGIVVARAKSVPSTDLVTLSFVSNYTVKTSENLILAASHKNAPANAGHLNYFSIVGADSSAADVNGLPINGNSMRISSYAAAELTFTKIESTADIEVGSKDVIVGEFKLQETNNTSTKDTELVSIRLRNIGSEKVASFDNFKLYNDGTLVSDDVDVDGEYITFSFVNDFEIKDGLSKNFTVKADNVEGQNNRTFQLELREKYDLKAIEKTTGIGTAIAAAGTATEQLSVHTIKGGKFNLFSDTTNPISANVSYEQTNQLGLVSKISLDQSVSILDGVKVYLKNGITVGGATDSEGLKTELDKNFKGVKLYVNNKLIDTVDTVTIDSATDDDGAVDANEFYYEFTNSFDLKNGDLIKVMFDVKPSSTATPNDTIGFVLDAANSFGGAASVEYANGDKVATTDRVGTVNGNTMTIKAASLTISDNSGYGTSTKIVKGTNGAKLAKFIINPGSASSVTVKRLKLKMAVNNGGPSEHNKYTSLELRVDGTKVGSLVNATDDTVNGTMFVTFDGLNVNIAKSAQKTFEVYGNVANDATADTMTVTVLGDSAGSTINDQNSVSIGFSDVNMASYTISNGGTITAAKDGSSPVTKLILANTIEQTVAKFKFQAADETMDITDLYIGNIDSSNSITDSHDSRFGLFSLYVGDSTTPIASKSLVGGKLLFEDLATRITIPANGSVVVTVKADVNSVNKDDQTNANLKLSLYAAKAVSQSRGESVDINTDFPTTDSFDSDKDIPTDLMLVRKTMPTFATQALGTTILTAGPEQTIYKATVVADAAGDVELSAINFDVVDGITTGEPTEYKLYIDGTEQTASEGAFVGSKWTFVAGKELLVGNSPKTLELKATIPTVVVNDYVSVRVKQDTSSLAGNKTDANAAGSNVVRSDLSGAPHTASTTDRFNGYKVLGLDTVSTTLTR